jgi:hypothetical protein
MLVPPSWSRKAERLAEWLGISYDQLLRFRWGLPRSTDHIRSIGTWKSGPGFGDFNMSHGRFWRWAWPFGIVAAGVGTAAAVLLRGCWHTHMTWPTRYDDRYSYRVCTDCGIKRLFDPESLRGYGRYGYDLPELIARDRVRRKKLLREEKDQARGNLIIAER